MSAKTQTKLKRDRKAWKQWTDMKRCSKCDKPINKSYGTIAGGEACRACLIQAVEEEMNKNYTLRADKWETEPFKSYDEAVAFGKAWLGKFSIFHEIAVYHKGKFLEHIKA